MLGTLAVHADSLPGTFATQVRTACELGFAAIDIVAILDRPLEDREALAQSGLFVSCAALGRRLPSSLSLDAESVAARRGAVEVIERQLIDAAQLGATFAYLPPGLDASAEGLRRFADACSRLADFAEKRGIRLCLEPCPGLALPSAQATLDWLNALGCENLSLLLDVGHCLLTNEVADTVVQVAGSRLAYLHLDDNDGLADVHWPLLAGRLSLAMLEALFRALHETGYSGPAALEIRPGPDSDLTGLRESSALVAGLLTPKTMKGPH